MIDDFDELFDKFFNDKGDKNKSKKIRSLIDRLNSFDDVNPTRFNPDENELGEPDEVDTYEDNGHTFQRSTWNLKQGSIVKIEILESNIDIGFDSTVNKKLTLDEKLEIALECENYEEAIIIRDKMKKNKDTNK
tara:strand:+ start:318 stop:719 length:402 start_codon:yes stop_codon:yes gene_type:complete